MAGVVRYDLFCGSALVATFSEHAPAQSPGWSFDLSVSATEVQSMKSRQNEFLKKSLSRNPDEHNTAIASSRAKPGVCEFSNKNKKNLKIKPDF